MKQFFHFEQHPASRQFVCLIALALIIRLLIMPFFGHVDTLSEARRIFFWNENGIYFDNISRNVTSLMQVLFFKVFSVFLEHKDTLLYHADMAHSTAHPIEYFEFVSHPEIFRTLFVIKLPFLFADMLTAWLIYRHHSNQADAQRAVIFWLFNPITLFAFYIFGRFEAIPILFCVLSLFALKRHTLIISACMVALCVNTREMFVFLGPVFIAIVCSPSAAKYSLLKRSTAVVIVSLGLLVALQVINLTGAGIDSFGRQISSIAQESRVDYLFAFILGSYVMFPFAYFLILLYAWNSQTCLHEKAALLFSCTFFAFFAFSSHTAHYLSWLMLFPCLYLTQESRLLKPLLLLCLTWFVFNLSITDLGVFTTWLASPWSIHLAGLPNFPAMYHALGIDKSMDLLMFQRAIRSFYIASLLYILALIITQYRSRTSIGRQKNDI